MLKTILAFSMVILLAFSVEAAKKDPNKTAEDIYTYVSKVEHFDKAAIKDLRSELKTLTKPERARLMDMVMKDVNEVKSGQATASENMVAIYILAVLLPPVAVGLYTDWETKPTVINLVLTLLGWLPGVVHAFIVIAG